MSLSILAGICLIPYQFSQLAESLLRSEQDPAAVPPAEPGLASAAAARGGGAERQCGACGESRHLPEARFCCHCGAALGAGPSAAAPLTGAGRRAGREGGKR